jgi:hypothetical protein
MGEPTPLQDLVVNDRYWLARARGMLDQAIRGRDDAAARLAAGVGWLWTVYTGAALVGAALRTQPLPAWAVGVLVAPALLLVAAYGLAVWAMLPIGVAFDPRVVQQIQQAHMRASAVKQQRLRLAGLATGVGALAVVAAVVVTTTVRAGPSGPSLAAMVDRQSAGQVMVLVTAQVPPGATVTVTVTPTQPGGAGRVARLLVADPTGHIHAELPVPPGGRGYRAQAAWSYRGQQWILTTVATDPTPTLTGAPLSPARPPWPVRWRR